MCVPERRAWCGDCGFETIPLLLGKYSILLLALKSAALRSTHHAAVEFDGSTLDRQGLGTRSRIRGHKGNTPAGSEQHRSGPDRVALQPDHYSGSDLRWEYSG